MATKSGARKVGAGAGQQWLLEQPSLKAVVRWYVSEHVSRKRGGTRKTYTNVLENLAEALPSPCTPGELHDHFSQRIESGELLPATANMRLRILRRCLSLATKLHWRMMVDFTIGVPPFPVSVQPPRAIENPEVTYPLLLASLPDARARAFVSMQRRLGFRVGEALGLEPRHVRLDAGEVSVVQQRDADHLTPGPLKSDTSAATMALHPETIAFMREAFRDAMRAPAVARKARARFVFPFFRPHLDAAMAGFREISPVDFAGRVAGVRGATAWHAFRHTFCTELVERGMPVHDAHLLMRHKHLNTTQGYFASIRGRVMPNELLRGLWSRTAAEAAATAALPAVGAVVAPFAASTGVQSTRGTFPGAGTTCAVSPALGKRP